MLATTACWQVILVLTQVLCAPWWMLADVFFCVHMRSSLYTDHCVDYLNLTFLHGLQDLHHDPNDPNTRLYATHAAQPYHNDASDIVGKLPIFAYTSSLVQLLLCQMLDIQCLHPDSSWLILFNSCVCLYEQLTVNIHASVLCLA